MKSSAHESEPVLSYPTPSASTAVIAAAFECLQAQKVQIAHLPLPRDSLAKNVSMTAQRNFYLGKSLKDYDIQYFLAD